MAPAAGLDAAFAAQPRERFLPAAQRAAAATDGPLDIGHGQTNSQPRTVRAMLELLDVGPGHRVLDVGAGSGWTTALLPELVGPGGAVLGVERVPELVELGRAHLAAAGVPWARVVAAHPDTSGHRRTRRSTGCSSRPRPPACRSRSSGSCARVGSSSVRSPASTRVVRARDGGPPTVTGHGRYRFVPLVQP